MLSGHLHPVIYVRFRGGKNTWDEKAPTGSGNLSGRFTCLQHELIGSNGCLSITDKKNFWIERHFDHHDPPWSGLTQWRLYEKGVQRRRVGCQKNKYNIEAIIFTQDSIFSILFRNSLVGFSLLH
jgi:hypothetical protein